MDNDEPRRSDKNVPKQPKQEDENDEIYFLIKFLFLGYFLLPS